MYMYIYQNIFAHMSERFARISFGKFTTGEEKRADRWKFYCINIHPKVTRDFSSIAYLRYLRFAGC